MKNLFLIIFCFTLVASSIVGAQEASPAKDAKASDPCDSVEEKVTKGNAATMGVVPLGNGNVDASTGGAAPGEGQSAVSASVSFKSDTKCEVKFSSSSKCFRYTVNYEINSSKDGSSFVTSSSTSLEPGASKTSTFTCKRGLNYSVNITKSVGTKIKKSK